MSQVDLTPLLGPFLLGCLFDTFFLGVVVVNCHRFYARFGQDSWPLTVIVTTLLLLAVAHTVMVCATTWQTCIEQFGDFAALAVAPWSLKLGATITGVSSLIVQCWYANRIWKLSRSWVLPVIIAFISLVSCSFSIVCTVVGWQLHYLYLFPRVSYGVHAWLWGSVASDLLITAGLVYYLRKAKKLSTFSETDSFLRMLIRNTIENNLMTLIVVVIDALLFALSHTAWHVFPNYFVAKLYFLSLLVALNSRRLFGRQNRISVSGSNHVEPSFVDVSAVRSRMARSEEQPASPPPPGSPGLRPPLESNAGSSYGSNDKV